MCNPATPPPADLQPALSRNKTNIGIACSVPKSYLMCVCVCTVSLEIPVHKEARVCTCVYVFVCVGVIVCISVESFG